MQGELNVLLLPSNALTSHTSMATRWKATVLALCVLCCETQLGTSAVHRDRTIISKISLLEEEITDIRSRMDRIDRKRKTDLQIFRNDLTLHLESVVPDVMSSVIEEMAKAGTIQGLIEGTVHTKVQSVEQQLQQLKTLALNSIKTKPPVPAKVGTLDSNKPTRKTFGKRFKRYDKIIKELKADGDNQKVMINELHSVLAEQRMLLEVLRMDMEKMTSRSGSTTKPGSETVTSYSTLTTKGLILFNRSLIMFLSQLGFKAIFNLQYFCYITACRGNARCMGMVRTHNDHIQRESGLYELKIIEYWFVLTFGDNYASYGFMVFTINIMSYYYMSNIISHFCNENIVLDLRHSANRTGYEDHDDSHRAFCGLNV